MDNSTDIKLKDELFVYLPCDRCDVITGKNNIDYRSFILTDTTVDACLDAAYLSLKNQN